MPEVPLDYLQELGHSHQVIVAMLANLTEGTTKAAPAQQQQTVPAVNAAQVDTASQADKPNTIVLGHSNGCHNAVPEVQLKHIHELGKSQQVILAMLAKLTVAVTKAAPARQEKTTPQEKLCSWPRQPKRTS
jgi:hypothetical protein